MNEASAGAFLNTEPLGALMRKYAVPCVISLLVAALYNIVDQIFIANASYLGSYGNAANTVVFPPTVAALAVAVMIGDNCCVYVSICLAHGTGKASTAASAAPWWRAWRPFRIWRSNTAPWTPCSARSNTLRSPWRFWALS